MEKIIVNGKVYNTKEWKRIYSDGNWSSRGVDVYVTPKKSLVSVPWSQWQGEDPKPTVITVKQFLEYRHSERVLAALKEAEIELVSDDL